LLVFFLLIRCPLCFNIIPNCIGHNLIPNCSDIPPVTPKFPSPKLFLYFGKFLKKLSCGYAFYYQKLPLKVPIIDDPINTSEAYLGMFSPLQAEKLDILHLPSRN
jgi:hypothetical protein